MCKYCKIVPNGFTFMAVVNLTTHICTDVFFEVVEVQKLLKATIGCIELSKNCDYAEVVV